MNNKQLFEMCFIGLENNKYGFGTKRIALNFAGTICEKIPVRGFGYKTQDQTKYIGIRLWIDQGDHTIRTPYIKGKPILQHFAELVNNYENKTSPRGAMVSV
tara:strand:- start:2287 stop:2592 length:306 start_codon:yes stop_codon:yes gene_type:complete